MTLQQLLALIGLAEMAYIWVEGQSWPRNNCRVTEGSICIKAFRPGAITKPFDQALTPSGWRRLQQRWYGIPIPMNIQKLTCCWGLSCIGGFCRAQGSTDEIGIVHPGGRTKSSEETEESNETSTKKKNSRDISMSSLVKGEPSAQSTLEKIETKELEERRKKNETSTKKTASYEESHYENSDYERWQV